MEQRSRGSQCGDRAPTGSQASSQYIARIERRFTTEANDLFGGVDILGDVYPDVGVVAKEAQVEYRVGSISPPREMTTFIPESATEYTIEIRTVADRRLVTSIEVQSPTNKRGEGYRDYLDKRERLLRSPAHLMEIDLLRDGKRVPTVEPLPDAPYFVFLSRAGQRPRIQVWTITLRDVLPVIPVPLSPGDADSALDLQTVLTNVYDALGYDLSINYRQPSDPPLKKEDAPWASAILRQAEVVTPPPAPPQARS